MEFCDKHSAEWLKMRCIVSDDVFDLEAPVTVFRFKGQVGREPLGLDVIAAYEAMNEIEKARDAKHPEGDAPKNFILYEFAKWLKTALGAGSPEFTPGELDSLWHGVLAAFLKKKRSQNELLDSMQTSPTSTEAESIQDTPGSSS